MKILHTSDWHLGKRLNARLRIDEQRAVMNEIAQICLERDVDVLLVAGDVFDTFVPPTEAEELFYETVLKISKTTLPVIISGNHDDGDRLCAPEGLARASGVLLLGEGGVERKFSGVFGGKQTAVTQHKSHVVIERGGEKLNLAFLNYPTGAKLADMSGEADYTDYVKGLIDEACACFTDGINVFVSHLFFVESDAARGERELGGSKLLPRDVLPKADYVALGHIHKPMCVSKDPAAYYSGSPMQLAFGDEHLKRVVEITSDGKDTVIESVPLYSYKKLVTVSVGSEQEAIEALERHASDYVRLEYTSSVPLSVQAMTEFKRHECFVEINVIANMTSAVEEQVRRGKSDKELFEMFYEKNFGTKPDPEYVEMFLRAVSGEEV